MHTTSLIAEGVTHQIVAATRSLPRRLRHDGIADDEVGRPCEVRDRGAVSLEQVLWFVAAGVSVAVIAAILWNRIRDEANTPIETPSSP